MIRPGNFIHENHLNTSVALLILHRRVTPLQFESLFQRTQPLSGFE
jgi:hypothetical protein